MGSPAWLRLDLGERDDLRCLGQNYTQGVIQVNIAVLTHEGRGQFFRVEVAFYSVALSIKTLLNPSGRLLNS